MIKRSSFLKHLLQFGLLKMKVVGMSEVIEKPTVYKRKLPNMLVSLSSHEGKVIFNESLNEGNCESFFVLVQQFITQSQPSTCGSASLAMVLNSLKIDPSIRWKGIWRWYDDYNIKHMHPSKIQQGITLQEFSSLAALNHAKSMAFSPLLSSIAFSPLLSTPISPNTQTDSNSDTDPNMNADSLGVHKISKETFRKWIIACTRRSNMVMTVNFHRKSLQQTGTGHFAPIAGYNADRQLVLILDVAKFKYQSYWCHIDDLFDSLKPVDLVSKISRGFVINKKNNDEITIEPYSPFCSLEIDHQLNKYLHNAIKTQPLSSFINDHHFHALLIPILFDFYQSSHITPMTSLFQQKSQQPAFTDHISHINLTTNDLTPATKELFRCFSNDIHLMLKLISTIMSGTISNNNQQLTKQYQNRSINLIERQLYSYIKKYQFYLELERISIKYTEILYQNNANKSRAAILSA